MLMLMLMLINMLMLMQMLIAFYNGTKLILLENIKKTIML